MKDGIHPEGYAVTKKKTNADRIRSMTDEELAAFCCKVKADYQWADHEFPDEDACGDWEEWLRAESEGANVHECDQEPCFASCNGFELYGRIKTCNVKSDSACNRDNGTERREEQGQNSSVQE